MKNRILPFLITGMLTSVLFAGLISCEKDILIDSVIDSEMASTEARAILSSRSVNWNAHSNGTYTRSAAATDFGNVSGAWQESRAYISNGTCRITLLKNALSSASGMIVRFDVSDGTNYEMDWKVKFHSQFDWSKGGKLGFGFLIGDGNTGGDAAWDGNGGSLRMMWYNTGSRVFLQPYVYYKDQPGTYGDSFGKSYPSSGSLQKGTWYNVHMWAQMNTGSNEDGWVEIKVNGVNMLRQNIRWVTNNSKRAVREVSFHTFRGGSQDYWKSNTDGYIYYDDLHWNKVN